MANSNVQTYVSNRLTITFDGNKTVGAIQNANISMSVGLDGVSGIGSLEMVEYVPTVARVSVTSDQSYIFSQEIERVGSVVHNKPIDSMNGMVFDISSAQLDGAAGLGATGQAKAFSTIWTASKCLLDSGDFSSAKHGVVGRRCSWQAISWKIGGAANS